MVTPPFVWVLAVVASAAVVATVPYMLTAIEFRQRDNGLAYIMFVLGIGVWNGMVVSQLLTPRPLIKGFFFSLAIVGSLIAGLGWFLFACTASSTPIIPNQRIVYGSIAVLVGLDITIAVTAPAHTVFWVLRPDLTGPAGFAVVSPRIGYWLHTVLTAGLFAWGASLFAQVWRSNTSVRYSRAYVVVGMLMTVSIFVSNLLAPGGLSASPIMAWALASIGWIQARRGRVFSFLRGAVGLGRV